MTIDRRNEVDPFAFRWKRRVKTIPAMLAVTVVALVFAPALIIGSVVWDGLRCRWRLPALRLYGFVCQYLINDSVEILLAGPLWIVSGCGLWSDSPTSRRRYQRIQAWSIDLLARRAEQLLGVRFELSDASKAALTTGPAIVLCRHVSVLDAALPSLLYERVGYHTRGVVMAELLADPGFDLLYQHAGSVFIARDNDPEARERVAAISQNLDARTVAVIFPEGRLFRADVLQRSLARLGERDPPRADRLARLEHLLPPRPAGLVALLDAAPDADVVVINHAGLDHYPTVAGLSRHIPLNQPIAVDVRRIPRDAIPDEPAARVAWLDALWCDMDRWVHQHLQT